MGGYVKSTVGDVAERTLMQFLKYDNTSRLTLINECSE